MFKTLEAQIKSILERSSGSFSEADITSAVADPCSLPCSPLEAYCLVAFLRHERRQQWVGFIVESRLRANGSELGRLGAFGHPESIPQSGDVPGELGWRYYFHGRGCCFTNTDGTSIDVDFADDGSALEIDYYFYHQYLTTAPKLAWIEQQMEQPEGLADACRYELASLVQRGFIAMQHRFRLTEIGRKLAETMEPALELLEESIASTRCFLLSSLGDFIGAAAEAKNCSWIIPELEKASNTQIIQRASLLRSKLQVSSGMEASHALAALVRLLGDAALPEVRTELVKEPVTCLNHTALSALKFWHTDECLTVMGEAFGLLTAPMGGHLLRRFLTRQAKAPKRESPWASLVVYLVRELLRHYNPATLPPQLRRSMPEVLRQNFGAMDDDAAFLLFLLNETAGRHKLSHCLTDPIPNPRKGAAAFLAIIGDDAAIEVLSQASMGNPDCGGHEAACALSCIDHPKAGAAAEAWQRRLDGYEEVEARETEILGKTVRTWSFEELWRSGLRERMRYDVDRKREDFLPMLHTWKKGSSGTG